jgi:hypothetical protein
LDKRAYLWHKKESLRYTSIFGRFACRVCSKILGIGLAERSWGDVKTLKTNKHSHLSGECVKKQATIFGASCIEQAKYQREIESSFDVSSMPLKFWRDDDFSKDDNGSGDKNENTKHKRVFKAFIEEWETEAIRKKDVVNEAKLLKKYGGLSWYDPDNGNKLLYASKTSLHWTRYTKKNGGGYCVKAHGPEYKRNEDGEEDDTEPWCINEDLIGQIEEYYKTNLNKGILVESNSQEKIIDDQSDD